MAGLINSDDSLEESRSLLRTNLFNTENLLLPNHNVANHASSIIGDQTTRRTTTPQAAAITSPPHLLELRQNNPQDCSNLITASVNRATVEISRTLIALNATFSQQLQQASISASNGIKSAQNSATSTIQIVVLSASSATSSAFSSLTIANLAVTSANFALTNAQSSASTAIAAANSSLTLANLAVTSISSASSSDVSTLSSSLSELQASLTSVQSSASAAIAAAQSVLAFVSGSAAAQASSILASAASATQGLTTVAPQQTLPTLQLPSTISLTPAQAAAIVTGAVVLTILLSFLIYFLVLKMKKRKERDSYLDEKDVASSPKKLPSRLSSALRTGNAMTLKFNPPKSSDAPPPPTSALRIPEEAPEPALSMERTEGSQALTSQINLLRDSMSSTYSEPPSWPLGLSSTNVTDISSAKPLSPGFTFWPLKADTPSSPRRSADRSRELLALNLLDTGKTDNSIPYTSPTLKQTFDQDDLYADQEEPEEVGQRQDIISSPWEQTHQRKETPDEIVFNPFEDGIEDLVSQQAENSKFFEQQQEAELHKPLTEQAPVQHITGRDSYSETANSFRSLERRVQREITPESFPEASQTATNKPVEEKIPSHSAPEVTLPVELQVEEWSFEQLLPQQPTRVPTTETLALLQNEDQARSSTVPEIDKLLRIVAQDNERLGDKPLFWSDFRPVEEDVEVAMETLPMRELEAKEETLLGSESLPPGEDQHSSEKKEEEIETVVSPLYHDTEAEIHHIEASSFSPNRENPEGREATEPQEPPSSPPTPKAERETSPLRMNPHIRNITSILAEHEAFSPPISPTLKAEINENEVGDRQARGRSMLRTSDIIEARLSSIVASKEINPAPTPNDFTAEERARTISPLRRNPVNPSQILEQRNRTLSPLQRKPSATSTSTNRRSRTLSPPSVPRLNPIPSPSLEVRDESPLRRNPPFQFPVPSQPIPLSDSRKGFDTASRPQSNAAFNQALARFQNLAEQSSNGRQASTEVTQRAIAGIFIPGSLREQAVRNLSKSRERLGKSESG